MNKRLTKKSVGVFKYDLADYEHKVGEFNDYDAFFAYSMAVKRLGELEDEHDNYQQEIENLKYKVQYLTDCGIELEEKYKEILRKCSSLEQIQTSDTGEFYTDEANVMKLLTVLKERSISKAQLAMKTLIHPSDLYCALNGKKPFYPAWRKRIAEYLQISEDELFGEGAK